MEEDPLVGDHGSVMTGFLRRISPWSLPLLSLLHLRIELTSPSATLHSGFLSGVFLVRFTDQLVGWAHPDVWDIFLLEVIVCFLVIFHHYYQNYQHNYHCNHHQNFSVILATTLFMTSKKEDQVARIGEMKKKQYIICKLVICSVQEAGGHMWQEMCHRWNLFCHIFTPVTWVTERVILHIYISMQ